MAPLTCDLEPEIPSSTTSSTAVRHCLSCIRWSCSVSHRMRQWNAAQIIEWRSLEWAGAGRLHWYMMNSQIQLIVRLHISTFGAVSFTLNNNNNFDIQCCQSVIRKLVYGFMCRLDSSVNCRIHHVTVSITTRILITNLGQINLVSFKMQV